MTHAPKNERDQASATQTIAELKARRPRSRLLRMAFCGTLALVVASWTLVDVDWSESFSARRLRNLLRFVDEINPLGDEFSFIGYLHWLITLWGSNLAASVATICISFVAICLAAAAAWPLTFTAARNWAIPRPFSDHSSQTGRKTGWWKAVVLTTRCLFIVSRAMPEYIWAFLLVALIGPSAWPAILALMLHNVGSLGKLGAEVIENLSAATPRALANSGATRGQIAIAGVIPAAMSKWLVFFFYRWETCIREATVLGMLGVLSLGYLILDSRARDRYDEVVGFALLGTVLILFVDATSSTMRRFVRER